MGWCSTHSRHLGGEVCKFSCESIHLWSSILLWLISLGDQFARWTSEFHKGERSLLNLFPDSDDVFKSTLHRVINHSGAERYSIPLFFGTNYDVVLEVSWPRTSLDLPSEQNYIANTHLRYSWITFQVRNYDRWWIRKIPTWGYIYPFFNRSKLFWWIALRVVHELPTSPGAYVCSLGMESCGSLASCFGTH